VEEVTKKTTKETTPRMRRMTKKGMKETQTTITKEDF
jgi:hypothetical protein